MSNQINMCRLCLSRNAHINVLENEDTLKNIITYCKIKVEKNDGLPEFICHSCMLRVEDVSKFIEQCYQNDKTLRLRCIEYAYIKEEKDLKLSNSIVTDDESVNFDICDDTADFNNVEKFSHSEDKPTSINVSLDNDTLMRSVQVAENGEEYVLYLGVRIIITRPKLLKKKTVKKKCAQNGRKRKYLCPICGLYMPWSHQSSHIEVKKFICDVCKKGFKTKFFLITHINRHHNDVKRFECNDCGKLFKCKDDLYKHIKFRHIQTPKPFACRMCNMTFFFNHNLMHHIKTHTGEKNVACPHCDMKFIGKSGLRTHLKTHTKEKPYSCKICLKSFSMTGTLRDHIRLHTGERPYECPICKKGFAQLGNMKSHFRHNHKGCKFEYYSLKKKLPCKMTIPEK